MLPLQSNSIIDGNDDDEYDNDDDNVLHSFKPNLCCKYFFIVVTFVRHDRWRVEEEEELCKCGNC